MSTVDLAGAEAIELYSSLLKAYPDYPRNDQVLYQLARAYETTGQPEKALATLDQVVQRYPELVQMDEVDFRRGEILFSNKRYGEAEQASRRASEGAPVHSTAERYKQAGRCSSRSNEESPLAVIRRCPRPDVDRPGRRQPTACYRGHVAPDRELSRTRCVSDLSSPTWRAPTRSTISFEARRATVVLPLYSRLGDLTSRTSATRTCDAYRAFFCRIRRETRP